MGKSNSQILGYVYYMGLHMGVAQAVDEFVEIQVDEKTAWSGSVTDNATVQINQPNLFGGTSSEGGIVGTIDFMFGAATQAVNSGLIAMLGSIANAFRKRATCFFNGEVCALSPYPKAWKFRVRRAARNGWDGTPWYAAKAVIPMASGAIQAMNGAHILYECCTNRNWGRGLDPGRLDLTSFTAAADTLYSEGFGLCLLWARTDTLSSFVQTVEDHIAATMFTDRVTGLITLKLIRDDYDPSTVPLYTADNGLIDITDDSNGAAPAATSVIIIQYHDQLTDQDGTVRVRNSAAVQSLGAVATTTTSYPGVSTADLALRLGQRDLRVAAGFIKRFKCVFDRRGYKIKPGSVFAIQDLARGIDKIILRAGAFDNGTLTDGRITVTALEDVFGLPDDSFAGQQTSTWVAPNTVPQVIAARQLTELTYRDLAQRAPTGSTFSALDEAGCYLGALATWPTSLSQNFELETRVGTSGAFTDRGFGDFSPSGLISAAILIGDSPAVVVVGSGVNLDQVVVGTAAMIDDEIFRVDGLDLTTNTATLARGCIDTVPAAHSSGARIWFYEGSGGAEVTEYAPGTVLNAKLLSNTSQGQLDPSLASVDSLTMTQRQGRPYPPAAVTINGSAFPSGGTVGTIQLIWAGRNRISQADQLVDFAAATIGAESGTGYSLQIKRADTHAVVLANAGIPIQSSGGAFNASGFYVAGVSDYELDLWSVREGLASRQTVTRSFSVTKGYGLDYGNSYGGLLTPGVFALKGKPPPVISPIPGLDTEAVVTIAFGGTFSASDSFQFNITFAPLGGTPISKVYTVSGSGAASLIDMASALTADIRADFGTQVGVAQLGATITLSTFYGILNAQAQNNTASFYTSVNQPAAGISAGLPYLSFLDYYDATTLAPDRLAGHANPQRLALITITFTPLTLAQKRAMGAFQQTVIVVDEQMGGVGTSNPRPLNQIAAAISADATCRQFLAGGAAGSGIVTGVAIVPTRAVVNMTAIANVALSTDFYDSVGPNSNSAYRILNQVSQVGSAAYPAGAKKNINVTFTTAYGPSGALSSLVVGQIYFIDLAGTRYQTAVTSGDVSDSPYMDGIYGRLKTAIEATTLYACTLNTYDRATGGTYVVSMDIESVTANVDFSFDLGASFGGTVTITES